MLSHGGINGAEQLASIMMGNESGNSEEFLFVGMSTTENRDESGRYYGYIGATYKGKEYVTYNF